MFHNIPGCTFEYDTLKDSAIITGFKTALEAGVPELQSHAGDVLWLIKQH